MVNQPQIEWTNRYFIRLLTLGALALTLYRLTFTEQNMPRR
jgi:hypothetical protein